MRRGVGQWSAPNLPHKSPTSELRFQDGPHSQSSENADRRTLCRVATDAPTQLSSDVRLMFLFFTPRAATFGIKRELGYMLTRRTYVYKYTP